MTTEFKTIESVLDAYDRKETSPLELTRFYLEKAKASNLNAYLTLCEDRALDQANAAETILAAEGKVPREKYPLLGVPLGIKDVLTIEGVKTTCASKILQNYYPPYTCTSVGKLEASGAISLGKMNMDEFAMGGSNENSAFGPVKHPTHPDRVPGGSSGGSAAAVKEGTCLASLGTDTGGSVRLPASFCGVTALKPTYGRISRFGLVAFASSLDQVGPIGNTVSDCAHLLEVMAGHDPMDSTSAPIETEKYSQNLEDLDLSGMKVGVPKEYFVEGLSDEVEASVREALKWYESKGAKLVDISLPHTKYAVSVYYLVAVSEASSNLARFDGVRYGFRPEEVNDKVGLIDFYKKVRANFGDEVKRRIILGTYALSSGYYDAYYKKACQVRRLIRNDFDEAFKEVDLIACPTSPVTAFKAGERMADPLQMYLVDIFTISASLAGLPAMSLPCGEDKEGLSIGLQLMGPHFQEGRLLKAASAFERR